MSDWECGKQVNKCCLLWLMDIHLWLSVSHPCVNSSERCCCQPFSSFIEGDKVTLSLTHQSLVHCLSLYKINVISPHLSSMFLMYLANLCEPFFLVFPKVLCLNVTLTWMFYYYSPSSGCEFLVSICNVLSSELRLKCWNWSWLRLKSEISLLRQFCQHKKL